MAKTDLFISKSPLGQGAPAMPYQAVSNLNVSASQAAAPLQTAAAGLDNIGAVFQQKRDIEVRSAVAGYSDAIKDNLYGEAFNAKKPGAPLNAVYEDVEDASGNVTRQMTSTDGFTSYQTTTKQFQDGLLAGITDSKVRKLVAAAIPTLKRAKDYEVASHYQLRQVDFVTAQRLHQIEARGDRLADALSRDLRELTPADIVETREDFLRSQTMFRSMADDGLEDWAKVPGLEETFRNELAENVFEGMIERARSAGATVAEDGDGLEVVTTPELDRLLTILASDEKVQEHARAIGDILGLPEDMVLDLQTEKRIAMLNDVHKKIEQVSDEHREEMKFQWTLEDRAQTERHEAGRRITVETFGLTEVMTDTQRQEWIAEFYEAHGFFPSGPNGTLTADDVIRLETTDEISSSWANTLRGWIAKGYDGDQDWATFIDFQKQIADADVNDLAGVQENIFTKARSLGTAWVSQLVGDITSRRTKTPDSEAHARAKSLLIKQFSGALDSFDDWTAKSGAVLGSALQRFSDQTRDGDGLVVGGLDYNDIAGSIFDELIGVDDAQQALENKIRPVVANLEFNNLSREAWGVDFLNEEIGKNIIKQSNKTLDILALLQAGASPSDFTSEDLKEAGLTGFGMVVTEETSVDELKRMMGVSPSMFTTPSSIQAARDDLVRLQSIRSRYLRRGTK